MGLKILNFFDVDVDPGFGIVLTVDSGSGMEKIRFRDPGKTSQIRNTDFKQIIRSLLWISMSNESSEIHFWTSV